MYTKEQKKVINTTFWGNVKKALNKVPDAEGKFIQWLNYPIKIKEVYLRLKVDSNKAIISLDIQSSDEGIREILWEQLEELRKVMESEMIHPAVWDKRVFNDAGHAIFQLRWELEGVSIYNEADEDKIIDFFRNTLIQFDSFYSEYGEILKNLAS